MMVDRTTTRAPVGMILVTLGMLAFFLGGICLPELEAAPLIGQHPRLLLAPASIAVLQARVAANTPEWQALKKAVDPLLTRPVPDSDALLISHVFALVYKLTGDTRYGDRAIEIALQVVKYLIANGQDPPNENFYRGNVNTVALTYDWTYDRLNATDKNTLLNYLARAAEARIINPCCGIGGNFWSGQLRTTGFIAAAIFGDYPNAQSLFDTNRDRFVNSAVPYLTTGLAKGGAWYEGTEYDSQSASYFLEYIEGVKTSTGEDLYPRAGFGPDRLLYTLHATSPTGYSVLRGGATFTVYEPMPYGDIQSNNQGYIPSAHRTATLELAYFFRDIGASTEAAYAQFWLTQFKPTYSDGLGAPTVGQLFRDFYYFDPTAPSQDYRPALPPDYLAPGMGKALSRSDWGPDATWVGFDCGTQNSNHQHAEANQFQIYRKGRWLSREVEGWGDSWFLSNLHSTLILNGHGSGSSVEATLGPISNNSKGSRGPCVVTRREVAADGSYAYTQGDATKAYQPRPTSVTPDVNLFLRDFLYLRPDVLVVADRVAYPAPAATVWNLQAPEPPTVLGNQVTVGNTAALGATASQVLYATSVTPADPQFTVVDLATLKPSYKGYRVEVRSGQTVTGEQFLFVLQAADQGTPPMPVGKVIASGISGAQFDKYVVGAPAGAQATGIPISYTYAPTVSATRHVLMGLNSLSSYKVIQDTDGSQRRQITIRDGAAGDPGSVNATAAGLLIFDVDDSSLPKGAAASSLIVLFGGDGQSGPLNSTLPAALQVRVLDPSGQPRAGINVNFAVRGGAATLSAPQAATDGNGIASVMLTLGNQAGPVVVEVTSPGLAGNPVRFNLKALPETAAGTPLVAAIVNSASFANPNPNNPPLSSNSSFTIFGRDLADGPQQAQALPLPTALAGTSVLLGDVPTPLLFVSPSQINAIAPPRLDALSAREIVIVRNGARSKSTFFSLVTATPGLYALSQNGSGPIVALRSTDFSVITTLNPVRHGEYALLYATGLGEVTQAPLPGYPAPANPLALTLNQPLVTLGGVRVPVTFSGLAPGFVSLFQVNILITDGVPAGTAVPISLSIAGRTSNSGTIAVQ